MPYGNSSGGVTGITSGTNLDVTKPIVMDNALAGNITIQLYTGFYLMQAAAALYMHSPANNGFIFAVAAAQKLKIASDGQFELNRTNTAAGTTGARTINLPAGSVNFAAAATSLVVTNSLVTTSSNIFCQIQTNDATMKSVIAVPASGSFTIFANAAATAETRVAFWVTN